MISTSTMTIDKIDVRLIDSSHEVVTVSWPVKDIEYVEELLYAILQEKKIGPLYCSIFGLRFTNQPSIWLAPNTKLRELLNCEEKSLKHSILDLRMRFRPSSYTKLRFLDRRALNFIFAQIRYDFLHTKFSDQKRDFVLLNDSVLALIATDLLRHALENNIEINSIFKEVSAKDFLPERAPKWQRSLLSHLPEKLNFRKAIQILGYETHARLAESEKAYLSLDDPSVGAAEAKAKALEVQQEKIKQGFIENFLIDVCKNYGMETYDVLCLDNPNRKPPLQIRIRYDQTEEESCCVLERRLVSQGSPKVSEKWTKLCDIYSVCYGTLVQNVVEIHRSNERPFKVEFQTIWHAKSFLSAIDGYYRHIRKWHFNFCRDVTSPYLEYLKKIKCHGPIGYESMRLKLTRRKKPGSFLVRKCMENANRFLIDVVLPTAILTINVDWDPIGKVYTKNDSAVDQDAGIDIVLNQRDYTSLKALINDLQIKLADADKSAPPLQLKNWLPPSEYDDLPALLHSMSKKKIQEFEDCRENAVKSLTELPRFIPEELLQFKTKLPQRLNNKMFVRLASLNGERDVIVKDCIETAVTQPSQIGTTDIVINLSYKSSERSKFCQRLSLAQLRLSDWVFVNNQLFAETIGIDLKKNSLIQEYFPLGQLDRYLLKSKNIPEQTKLLISCQLALSLLFLQEKRTVHGKIRCHNIFIVTLDPIQIKITDPLGTFNSDSDRAFLPPEYFYHNGQLIIPEYDPGIDVWALGTTIWQIYSGGIKPPPMRYANTLIQPSMCPDQVWSIIEKCWAIDPSVRASPQSIYRDLNDTFAWERALHNYDYISKSNEAFDLSRPTSDTISSSNDQLSCKSRTSTSFSSGSLGSGSQTNLLSTKMTAVTNSTINPNNLTREQNPKRAVREHLRGIKRRSWKGFMSLRGSSSTLNSEKNPDDRSGSKMSLSTCSTSSDSEKTKSTMLVDSQSLIIEHNCNIDSSKLRLGAEIGRGSCGVVIKGVLLDWTGTNECIVAIKRVNSTDIEDSSSVNDLRREAEILRKLDHENIVKLLGIIEEESVSLVLEYMPLGSLLSYIRTSNADCLLTMPLQKYAVGIAKGMEYLESQKIVHRDLALRNVLLKDKEEVKICDFGLAQYLGSSGHYKLKTDRALPLKWYAPEALQYWTFNHKTDVWSFGIVLWEIYSGGSNPQYSGTYADLSETLKHERLLKPKDCPQPIYDLMLSCWAYEPERRETFTQIRERLANMSELSFYPGQ